jgi:purine-binding chemotaxis protein CheW
MEENAASGILEYLTFRLGDGTYGINVGKIKEVLGVPRITRVPRMPEYMSGVANLRGSVIPVIDLRLKFGMGPTQYTEDTGIIVTEVSRLFGEGDDDSVVVGIFSDGVQKVVTIEEKDIEPPPRIGTAIDTEYIAGMGKVEDSFVVILNIEKALASRESESEKETSIDEA